MNYESLKNEVFSLLDEMPKHLFYHSAKHTNEVIDFALAIAKSEGFSLEEIETLKIAALFHDTGFSIQYHNNEQFGVKIAQAILPKHGYSEKQIEIISSAILATAMPQSPKNKIEEVLCDADLAYLGSDLFYMNAFCLKKEWEIERIFSGTLREWFDLQLQFLISHNYFTSYATKNFSPKKSKFINEIRELSFVSIS